jgi:hypothetical protein
MSDDLVKRLKKWADGEAMAAYGENLVDHPDEHEGSQISELIDTLTDRIEELEAERDEAVSALNVIDALDPETAINGFSESALRGLVLRMGELARTTLAELKGEKDD